MKRFLLLTITTVCFLAPALGQTYTLERDVFCAFGNFAVDPATGLNLSYTAGETVIKTGQSLFGSLVLTQGFQQAEGFTVGIDDPVQVLVDFEVFPNPTAGMITIKLNADRPAIMYLVVMDVIGQMVPVPMQQARFTSTYQTQMDMSELPDGYYLLGIMDEGKRLIQAIRIEKVY